MDEKSVKKKKKKNYLWNSLLVAAIVISFSFVSMNLVSSPIIISGSSMQPTLNNKIDASRSNDQNCDYGRMYTNNFKKNHIKRFDIIIFYGRVGNKTELIVKRVIGLPHETISINENTGELTVNNRIVEQDFISQDMVRLTCGGSDHLACGNTVTIPDNSYYVLGDNRKLQGSIVDSEHNHLGYVNIDQIKGVLWFIYATCTGGTKTYKDANGEEYSVCISKKITKIRLF